jgi:hypothetical protein
LVLQLFISGSAAMMSA